MLINFVIVIVLSSYLQRDKRSCPWPLVYHNACNFEFLFVILASGGGKKSGKKAEEVGRTLSDMFILAPDSK